MKLCKHGMAVESNINERCASRQSPSDAHMKTVLNLANEVYRLNLIGRDEISSMSTFELSEAYNGTGPEFLPERIRERLDTAVHPFLPAVLIHDVDFTNSDGTVWGFRRANHRMLVNCVICSTDAWTWINWRRYVLLIESYLIYRACVKFGWIAWRLAYLKKTTKTKE